MSIMLSKYKELFSNLKRYNSLQEKNAVLYCMDDEPDPIRTAQFLGANPSNILEAVAFIFKLREISVSDLVEITYKCDKCEMMNAQSISIPNMFFKDDDLHADVPIKLFTSVDDITLNEKFPNDLNINTMTIDEFNLVEDKILENNLKIFDPRVSLTCRKCGDIFKTQVIFSDILSKYSITNIYEQYLDISYFTNMTKNDTDNMFPFEREIFLGLIQTKEDDK